MFKTITLYTNQLKQLQRFYVNILNLPIESLNQSSFSVKIGTTKLIFSESNVPATYHFAINIPGNQFSIIKDWVENRYPLQTNEGLDEIYRSQFDADSFYIEDPSGNLVEFIGRRSRDFLGSFSIDAFYDISEISIVTPFVYDIGEQIQDEAIPLHFATKINEHAVNYLGENDTFLVLVPENRKWAFSERESETHPLIIELTNEKIISVKPDGKINVAN